jgi:hypothetical protein
MNEALGNVLGGTGVAAFLGGFMIFFFLIIAGAYVINSILLMKIFKKFDIEGWKAWVPFVNNWTFLEIGGQHGWWQFVPVANVIFMIIAVYNIGLKFNKSGAFVVLYIFIPIIWMIIMAIKSTTLSGSSSGEIGIGGLGVSTDQTVFATPAGSVGTAAAATAGSAEAAPVEDFTKPAASEPAAEGTNDADQILDQISNDTVETPVEPIAEAPVETPEPIVSAETPADPIDAPAETVENTPEQQ